MFVKRENLGNIDMQNIPSELKNITLQIQELNRLLAQTSAQQAGIHPGATQAINDIKGRISGLEQRRDTYRMNLTQEYEVRNSDPNSNIISTKYMFKEVKQQQRAAQREYEQIAMTRAMQGKPLPEVSPVLQALNQAVAKPTQEQIIDAAFRAVGGTSHPYDINASAKRQMAMNFFAPKPYTELNALERYLRARPEGGGVFIRGPSLIEELVEGFNITPQRALGAVTGVLGVGGFNKAAFLVGAFATGPEAGIAATTSMAMQMGYQASEDYYKSAQRSQEIMASLFADKRMLSDIKYTLQPQQIQIRQNIQRSAASKLEGMSEIQRYWMGEQLNKTAEAQVASEAVAQDIQYTRGLKPITTSGYEKRLAAEEMFGLRDPHTKQELGKIVKGGNLASVKGEMMYSTRRIPLLDYFGIGPRAKFEAEVNQKAAEITTIENQNQVSKIDVAAQQAMREPQHQVNNYENLRRIRQVEEWQFKKGIYGIGEIE